MFECSCVRCVAVQVCTAVWLMASGRMSRQGKLLLLWAVLLCTGHGQRVGSLTLDNSLSRVSTGKGIQTGVMQLVLTLVYSNSRARETAEQHNNIKPLQEFWTSDSVLILRRAALWLLNIDSEEGFGFLNDSICSQDVGLFGDLGRQGSVSSETSP